MVKPTPIAAENNAVINMAAEASEENCSGAFLYSSKICHLTFFEQHRDSRLSKPQQSNNYNNGHAEQRGQNLDYLFTIRDMLTIIAQLALEMFNNVVFILVSFRKVRLGSLFCGSQLLLKQLHLFFKAERFSIVDLFAGGERAGAESGCASRINQRLDDAREGFAVASFGVASKELVNGMNGDTAFICHGLIVETKIFLSGNAPGDSFGESNSGHIGAEAGYANMWTFDARL